MGSSSSSSSSFFYSSFSGEVQPVAGKMRLEMVIGIQNEILSGESWCLLSNEPYEKKPVMTIEDFVCIPKTVSSLIF